MATLFQQRGRRVYDAKIKIWDDGKGVWRWKKIATGLTDPDAALAVAVALEHGSEAAKAGHMTKAKAEALVSSILQLAGVPWGMSAVTLEAFGVKYVDKAASREKDELKAKAPLHWRRFKKWAGEKVKWPMENWTVEMFQAYYEHLRAEYSERTANDHIATFRRMFAKAQLAGKIKGNPAALVDKDASNSIEKDVFRRGEMARMCRLMAREGRLDWCLLILLGWHTGHRIQDLLSLTKDNVSEAEVGWVVTFQPGKKEGRGGRTVTLPLPSYLAKMLLRFGDLTSIHGADNRNGRASNDFVAWMERAGIDPMRIDRGKRRVPRKSFHSFRHSMATRLAAAGVPSNLAALVTDHDDPKMQAHYTHAEVVSIAGALKKARRV